MALYNPVVRKVGKEGFGGCSVELLWQDGLGKLACQVWRPLPSFHFQPEQNMDIQILFSINSSALELWHICKALLKQGNES